MRISIEIVSHELIGFESGFDAKISKGQEVLLKHPEVEWNPGFHLHPLSTIS